MKRFVYKFLVVLTPLCLATTVGMAADQSDQNQQESSGVAIIRVPLDEQGNEVVQQAEQRILTGAPLESVKAMNPEDLWARSVTVTDDSATDDSSTRRLWHWGRPYGGYYSPWGGYYQPYGGYSYYYYPYYYPYYYGW